MILNTNSPPSKPRQHNKSKQREEYWIQVKQKPPKQRAAK
ncbi:hypothetical protein SynPROSU1_00625 [Synechococcus sp. PROS-U-1]|nr:hypothetical protein SynPROSU1_00625 [Synechococcus sp. PROS-U-1]